MLSRTLPYLLALLFALQVGAVVPLHHFHEAEQAAGKTSLPEDCRCDLCIGLRSLDPGSVAAPPVLELAEAAFAFFALPISREIPAPLSLWRARGPPFLMV